MGFRPRRFEPNTVYSITSRTIDGRYYLRPSVEANDIIYSILAEAQERYDIELFDFVVMSNHMHLALRSSGDEIPGFMQYLKANMAVRLNRLLGRSGTLWDQRYAASPILDAEAEEERARYIYAHGVKESLVRRPEQWPGVASVKERMCARAPAAIHAASNSETRDGTNSTLQVRLSPWPFLANLPKEEQEGRMRALIRQACREARAQCGTKPVLGVRGVLDQDPFSCPREQLRRRPVPLCHATRSDVRSSYRAMFAEFLQAYRHASLRYRAGDFAVEFPAYSYPPPLCLVDSHRRRAGPMQTTHG